MSAALPQTPPPTLLRRKDVEARTGLSRSSVYRLLEKKCFPVPVDLMGNGRCVGWIDSEITTWINDRVAASRTTNGDGQ